MSLSTKSQNILVVALSNKAAAQELVKIVTARSGTASRTLQQCLGDALISKTMVEANGRIPVGLEVLNALTSGANLSLKARQRILTMMADKVAGNELINFIQSVAQSSNTTL